MTDENEKEEISVGIDPFFVALALLIVMVVVPTTLVAVVSNRPAMAVYISLALLAVTGCILGELTGYSGA